MVQTTFALMTNVGRAKEAAALANGTTVNITQIAIGDGVTVPSGGETALYNEVARKAISGHGTVTGATNTAYFDAYLAAADGPYTIREAGLYDDTGALIAIAHYDPPINKPVPASGTTVEGTIRMEVAFSNVATITIVVDPSFTVALQRLSRLPWIPVISMTITAPPAAVVGDCYLIPAGATGSWSGNAGKIAEYTTAGWAMITPPNGHGISLPDGRVFERVSAAYVEKIALDAQSGKWNFALVGGTANAITLALTPAPDDYSNGMQIEFRPAAANTGATTIKLGALATIPVLRFDGTPCAGGEFIAGVATSILIDATNSKAIINGATAVIRNSQHFNASGTFTVPAGVTRIYVQCWGGGGAGGGIGAAAGSSGGAGGGGEYREGWFTVVPGATYAVTVPAFAPGGGSTPTNGATGGTVSFGALMSAIGGGGGLGANGSQAGPGAGGTGGSGGSFSAAGTAGTGGNQVAGFMLASNGGASYGFPSFTPIGAGAGLPGIYPGTGGGGAGGGNSAPALFGGNGAAGQVVVSW